MTFYYDSQNKIYDSATGQLVKDKVSIMNFNTQPDALSNFNNDINWEIVKEYRNADGYINSKKVEVSFFDLNDDGSVDDPDIFDVVVDPVTNTNSKYVFFKKELTNQGFNIFNFYAEGSNILVKSTETEIGAYSQYTTDPQVFYIVDQNNFKILYSAEPKIDGISASLIFKNGKFHKGLSRGDGKEGEDITLNLLTIKDIPKKISDKDFPKDIDIRGEVFIQNSDFENLKEKFANPRNAASGSLRQKNPEDTKKIPLNFIAYTFGFEQGLNLKKQSDFLKKLEEWGFKIEDPEAEFELCDANSGGQLLFGEFADWAIKKGLELEKGDD